MVKFLLKKYAANQAIAENDAGILSYVQAPNTTAQQNADNLITVLCKVADVYDEDTLNDVSTEVVDGSIKHSPRNYRETISQADLTNIPFQAASILSIRRVLETTRQAISSTSIQQRRRNVNREILAT